MGGPHLFLRRTMRGDLLRNRVTLGFCCSRSSCRFADAVVFQKAAPPSFVYASTGPVEHQQRSVASLDSSISRI